jgi:hypothetical protein
VAFLVAVSVDVIAAVFPDPVLGVFSRCLRLCLKLSLGLGRSGSVCEIPVGVSVTGESLKLVSKSTIGRGLSIIVGVLVLDEFDEAAVRYVVLPHEV